VAAAALAAAVNISYSLVKVRRLRRSVNGLNRVLDHKVVEGE
jgi:hypothetical protein